MQRYPAILALLFLGSTGCAEDRLEPTTESLHEWVFVPHCGIEGCHREPQPAQGLNFHTVGTTLETMVEVPPSVGLALLSYPAIVQPGDPDRSFLIAKVTRPGVEQGLAMPPTDWMLTAETVEVIRQWIAQMEPSP